MTDANDHAAPASQPADRPLEQPADRPSAGRSGRRRASSPAVNTIYWRDIPAQLTTRGTDSKDKVMLPERFQHAIDRAAGVAGMTSTDDYVEEWRTESTPLADGDTSAQLDQLRARIEAAYTRQRLESIVTAGGVDVNSPSNDATPGTTQKIDGESE